MPHNRNMKDMRAPVSNDGSADAGPGVSNDPRFDRWISRQLHETYDAVLREKLPPDLERLVLAFRSMPGSGMSGQGDDTHDDRLADDKDKRSCRMASPPP